MSRLIGLLFALLSTAAWAQDKFPERPIRLIVPFGAGGLADVTFRLVAEKLTPLVGQQVIVENHPGAGGVAAANAALAAKPDGHTLLVIANGTAIASSLFKKLPYDPVKDLQPVSLVGWFDLLVLVKGDSPYRNLSDLLAAARKNPGKLNFATINPGSTQNLSAELFSSVAGIDVAIVPFKTSPDALTALIGGGGGVDAVFESYAAAKPLITGGRMRALASTGDRRYGYLPEVPTAMQAGLEGYEVSGWNAIAAHPAVPKSVIAYLNNQVNAVVAMPDVKARMLESGILAHAGKPEELRAQLVKDTAKWAAVIRKAGIPQQ